MVFCYSGRSRQANRNNRLKKAVAFSASQQQPISQTACDEAPLQPDLMSDHTSESTTSDALVGTQTSMKSTPLTLTGMVLSSSDVVVQLPEEQHQQTSSETMTLDESRTDCFKSPKRKRWDTAIVNVKQALLEGGVIVVCCLSCLLGRLGWQCIQYLKLKDHRMLLVATSNIVFIYSNKPQGVCS